MFGIQGNTEESQILHLVVLMLTFCSEIMKVCTLKELSAELNFQVHPRRTKKKYNVKEEYTSCGFGHIRCMCRIDKKL